MNKLLKYVLFLLIPIGCFWACSDESEPIIEPSIELLDGKDVYTVEAEGGTIHVKFVSTMNWTAVSNSEFCKLSETQGSEGTVSLTLTVAPNEDFEGREAIVTLRSQQVSVKFLIKQMERGAVQLSMKHTCWENFTLPVFSGNNLNGTVYWGDGQQEELQKDAVHQYKEDKEYTVTVELTGVDMVTWQDIKGLVEINLSDF